MMAFNISDALVSYDIEGAQAQLDELTLSNYPGEDISAFYSDDQKQIKVMQSGYALPIRVGSKLLMKCTKTECEYFNWKVFDHLDKVKDMEYKYKIADPAPLTNDPGYHAYGPLGVIAWSQQIHSKFLADHEWPGLASNLSHLESTQRNSVQTKGKLTCYHCGEDGHIKPNCPKLQAGVPKNDERQKEWRPLAALKNVRPNDITNLFVDEDKVEWNFCTKCIAFTTRNKGIWSLTHSDAEHKTISRTTTEDTVKAEDKGKA
jgi:hypothetical protein